MSERLRLTTETAEPSTSKFGPKCMIACAVFGDNARQVCALF